MNKEPTFSTQIPSLMYEGVIVRRATNVSFKNYEIKVIYKYIKKQRAQK